MVKRSREQPSLILAQQHPKQENPTSPPPSKRGRDLSVGGGAAGTSPVENRIAGYSLSSQPVAGETEAHASWDVGATAVVLPRWWQLWLRRSGGAVVDYEDLLCGWFPFVDEDFSSDTENAGWLSIWGDHAEVQQEGVLYDDVWEVKYIDQVPSHSR